MALKNNTDIRPKGSNPDLYDEDDEQKTTVTDSSNTISPSNTPPATNVKTDGATDASTSKISPTIPQKNNANNPYADYMTDDQYGFYDALEKEMYGEHSTRPIIQQTYPDAQGSNYHRNIDYANRIASSLLSEEEQQKRIQKAAIIDSITQLGNVFNAISKLGVAKHGGLVGEAKMSSPTDITKWTDQWKKEKQADTELKSKAMQLDEQERQTAQTKVDERNFKIHQANRKDINDWISSLGKELSKKNASEQKAIHDKAMAKAKHGYRMEELKTGASNQGSDTESTSTQSINDKGEVVTTTTTSKRKGNKPKEKVTLGIIRR